MSAVRPRSLARFLTALLLAGTAISCSDATEPEEARQIDVVFAVTEPSAVSEAETAALAGAFDRVDRYEITVVVDATDAPVASASIPIASGAATHTLEIAVPESAAGATVRIVLVAYDGAVELYRSTTVTTLASSPTTTQVSLEIRYSGPGVRGLVVDTEGSGLEGVTVTLVDSQSEASVAATSTDDDGSYLFAGIATGDYQVTVTPPGQTAVACPGSRFITVASADESILADFRVGTSDCVVRVLVLSGGDFDDTGAVSDYLSSDESLSVSTFFFVNQLPTLATLTQYDVVLLFSNGLFDESVALGNRVAQYVAAGGNLVLGSFYWQVRSDSQLGSPGWGALETFDPFTSNGGATYTLGSFASSLTHPLTTGVTTVTSTGFWGGAAQRDGSTNVVAIWNDESPFIGYRVLSGGQRIVGVTLFPASGSSAAGDWERAFGNAVSWAGEAGGPVPR